MGFGIERNLNIFTRSEKRRRDDLEYTQKALNSDISGSRGIAIL